MTNNENYQKNVSIEMKNSALYHYAMVKIDFGINNIFFYGSPSYKNKEDLLRWVSFEIKNIRHLKIMINDKNMEAI